MRCAADDQQALEQLCRYITRPALANGCRLTPLANCGGDVKIIAAILEQPVIEKIRTHLGLRVCAPPRAPARGQALQAVSRCPTVTIYAARRAGSLESAALGCFRDRWMRPGGKV